MHHRHMRGHHPHGVHILLKIMFVFLIFGALFGGRNHGRHSTYWQGFQAGVASVTQGESAAESPQSIPPVAPHTPFHRGWGGPGIGALFLLPLCGLALFGFMGFLFAIAKGSRRGHGPSGGKDSWSKGSWGGPWGRGCWGEDDTSMGRQVDDDEIGPEKSPEDII